MARGRGKVVDGLTRGGVLDVKVTYHNQLLDIDKRMLDPFVDLVKAMLMRIKTRVASGIKADGTPRPVYGPKNPKPPGVLFWVWRGGEQPDGYAVKLETGDLAGFAGYRSYAHWLKLTGKGKRPISYVDTGQFLNSMRVRVVSPTQIKIQPSGRNKGSRRRKVLLNSRLGRILTARARWPILDVAVPEANELVKQLAGHIEGLAGADDRQAAFRRRVKANTLLRRAKRAQKIAGV